MPYDVGMSALGGLAEGLKSGLLAYRDQSRYLDEKSRQEMKDQQEKDQQAAFNAAHGLIKVGAEWKKERSLPGSGNEEAGTIRGFLGPDASSLPQNLSGEALDTLKPYALEKMKLGGELAKEKFKGANKDYSQSLAKEKYVGSLGEKLQKDLDPDARLSGNAGKISQTLINAQKLRALVTDPNGGPANLTGPQATEFATGLAAMLAPGGTVSDARVHDLVPQSMVGNAQDIKSWLLNEPMGRNQQAFVKLGLDTLDREEALARKQLSEIQKRRLGSHQTLHKEDPAAYKSILEKYGLDESGGLLSQQASPSSAPETKSVGGKTYKKVQGGWEQVGG